MNFFWLPIRFVNGIHIFPWHKLPRLVRGERQDRREHLAQAGHEPMQRGLRRVAAMRIRRVGVKPVFDYVVVNRGQLHGDELADFLINDVEFVVVVGFENFLFELGELAKYPAVEAGELVIRDGVLCRIEVVKVRELVTQGVADDAVGFADLGDAFLAHDDVAAVILRCNP